MALYGSIDYTPEFGDPTKQVDVRDTTKLNNAAKNPLGAPFYTVLNTTAANPFGSWAKFRYVRYNSATNPATVARPAVVYWTDKLKTTVSGTLADGFTATAADVAGILVLTSAGFTNAQLNGNFCWIQVGGVALGVNAPGATAVGDYLIGAAGNFTLARIAAAAAQTCNPVVGYALSAVAANASDMYLTLEQ